MNLQGLYSLDQRVVGVRTGNRASAERVWREAWRDFRPPLAATFPLDEAAKAHRFLEEDRNVGRVALVVDP